MKTLLLLYLSLFLTVDCFKFEDPNQDGVTFGDSSGNTQTIFVDENNDSTQRVKFVLLSDVENCDKLVVNPINDNKNVLKIEIETGLSYQQCYLSAVQLDYENAVIEQAFSTVFSIDVYFQDVSTLQSISLNIVNLDDENPTLSSGICIMEEETVIDINTSNCSLTVTDRDGFLNSMNFIQIDSEVNETFELVYKEAPKDDVYEAQVYLVLKTGVKLDYETTRTYNFYVNATDSANHPTVPLESVSITLGVEDINDQGPQWTTFQTIYTITEENETEITVAAKDGDIGINSKITYNVIGDFVQIDKETGKITISAIDRDDNYDQVTFNVTAIEVMDPNFNITSTVTLNIEDIDDNIAELTAADTGEKLIEIEVEENSLGLNVVISACDKDLANNAMYSLNLTTDADIDLSSAIIVVPGNGYEETNISLYVIDPSKLNYEDESWQIITMTLTSYGIKNPENIDTLPITIKLKDINDEVPSFNMDEYTVDISEKIPKDYVLINIIATDLDAEDINAGLKHELIGTMANGVLKIETFGGNITTIKENAFDYERETQMIIEIVATDAVGHNKTTQLIINVVDENDESPKLDVSSSLTVKENTKDGYNLTSNSAIIAYDVDTNAKLSFSIDWGKSYATKNSRRISNEILANFNCVKVTTVAGETVNQAQAELSLVETQTDNTPDFESFDTLYIYLVVTDENTVSGDDSDAAYVEIIIEDVNDNPPQFKDGTETEKRTVTENCSSGTIITNVIATDPDTISIIQYSIEPIDDNPNWVAIDEDTGDISISLQNDDKVDCDEPIRYNLTYQVTASDGDFTTTANIIISIVDQNDNVPVVDDQAITIEEIENGKNQNDKIILALNAVDKDRDAPNNDVVCSFDSSVSDDVTNRFAIEDNNIKIYLTNGANLDREEFPDGFSFELDCIDNPGQENDGTSNLIDPKPKIKITLSDINDNNPELIPVEFPVLNENQYLGDIKPDLQAQDEDEGSNGTVNFVKISKILRFFNQDDEEPAPDPPQTLIEVKQGSSLNQGTLTIKQSLKDYWGFLVLYIELEDEGSSQLKSTVNVTLEISKYNYKSPKFTYPEKDGQYLYLSPTQTVGTSLKLYNDTIMQNITVDDMQNGKFSFNFILSSDDSNNPFTIQTLSNNESELQITNSGLVQQLYKVTITASIIDETQGESDFVTINLNIDFFDHNTQPIFPSDDRTDIVNINENEDIIKFSHKLKEEATYNKPELPDDIKVYYFLKEGNTTVFKVDRTDGSLTLLTALDYESNNNFQLVILASNAESINPTTLTKDEDESRLTLTINVIDVNDNAPVFDPKEYVSALTSNDELGTELVHLNASDKDTTSQDKLKYTIEVTSISDPSLNIDNPFKVSDTGVITSNFQPEDGKHSGFFTLTATVLDEDDQKDEAEIRIYLVT